MVNSTVGDESVLKLGGDVENGPIIIAVIRLKSIFENSFISRGKKTKINIFFFFIIYLTYMDEW